MKKMLIILALLLAVSPSYSALQPPEEKEVQIGVSGAFVPSGQRAGNDAYVVVNGIFPNGCYKWARAEITSRAEFNSDIKTIASVTQGMCIMVLIPFQKEVHLGHLSVGIHTLKFLNGDGTYIEKTLTIE